MQETRRLPDAIAYFKAMGIKDDALGGEGWMTAERMIATGGIEIDVRTAFYATGSNEGGETLRGAGIDLAMQVHLRIMRQRQRQPIANDIDPQRFCATGRRGAERGCRDRQAQ
jgi:hypothetical protein